MHNKGTTSTRGSCFPVSQTASAVSLPLNPHLLSPSAKSCVQGLLVGRGLTYRCHSGFNGPSRKFRQKSSGHYFCPVKAISGVACTTPAHRRDRLTGTRTRTRTRSQPRGPRKPRHPPMTRPCLPPVGCCTPLPRGKRLLCLSGANNQGGGRPCILPSAKVVVVDIAGEGAGSRRHWPCSPPAVAAAQRRI